MPFFLVVIKRGGSLTRLNPFRAPEPLHILNPSIFVPKNGFPVVKGLTQHRLNYIVDVVLFRHCNRSFVCIPTVGQELVVHKSIFKLDFVLSQN